jgi:2-dehydro-3-deoxygluconokinase
MTRLHPSQFSWPELVTDKDVAFTTGITCSLGNEPMRAVQAFFGAARNRGCRTAFDLNYRSRLWSWKQATSSLRTLLESVSVLFAGADDLSHLFEVDGGDPLLLARKVVTDLGPEIVVLRETSTLRDRAVRVTVTAVTKTDVVISQVHEAYAFDAFGAGDAATAAFLVMWLAQTGLEVACDAAAWACAFQHTIPGDAWQGRISDLEGRHEILRRILR